MNAAEMRNFCDVLLLTFFCKTKLHMFLATFVENLESWLALGRLLNRRSLKKGILGTYMLADLEIMGVDQEIMEDDQK